MSIRKISRKLFISTAAFFWASCGGDSEYPPVASNPPNDLTSSTSSFPTSSSEIEESSSSDTPSSSSEAVQAALKNLHRASPILNQLGHTDLLEIQACPVKSLHGVLKNIMNMQSIIQAY